MKYKRMIVPERRRKIPAHFSWIDHRVVRNGYTRKCSARALGFYLFLLSVSDIDGLSYYGNQRISREINIQANDLEDLRKELINAGLIAYSEGIYQVLELESENKTLPENTYNGSRKVSEILEEMFSEVKK